MSYQTRQHHWTTWTTPPASKISFKLMNSPLRIEGFPTLTETPVIKLKSFHCQIVQLFLYSTVDIHILMDKYTYLGYHLLVNHVNVKHSGKAQQTIIEISNRPDRYFYFPGPAGFWFRYTHNQTNPITEQLHWLTHGWLTRQFLPHTAAILKMVWTLRLNNYRSWV